MGYHSSIRISTHSMQSIMELRNQLIIKITYCHELYYDSYHFELKKRMGENEDEDERREVHQPLCCHTTCNCSLAQDCIRIIDYLVSNECFHLCEYNGPVSVES